MNQDLLEERRGNVDVRLKKQKAAWGDPGGFW